MKFHSNLLPANPFTAENVSHNAVPDHLQVAIGEPQILSLNRHGLGEGQLAKHRTWTNVPAPYANFHIYLSKIVKLKRQKHGLFPRRCS